MYKRTYTDNMGGVEYLLYDYMNDPEKCRISVGQCMFVAIADQLEQLIESTVLLR